ncbi:unnamed protein product [Symbiodinium sp. CCMP2456]|nr:unnamed protein product [Symbiodinium sp. CCMP2456]
MARLLVSAVLLRSTLADGPLVDTTTTVPDDEFVMLPGYCEPNWKSNSLCSASSDGGPRLADTCEGTYAGKDVPIGGDWSRETGFAYFHPDSCDEACAKARCLADANCAGMTVATFAFDSRRTAALKSSVSGSTDWEGYECLRKATWVPTSSAQPLSPFLAPLPLLAGLV